MLGATTVRPVDHLAEDELTIFLFHGVVTAHRHHVRNYTRKHVDAASFRATLRDLADAGNAVTMDDVVQAHRAGRPLPPRAYAITFDDGFRNNLTVAAPILREMRTPATFYVTTSFVAEDRMSWIDRIENAVEATPVVDIALPPPLGRRRAATPTEKQALLSDIRIHVKGTASVDPDAYADDAVCLLGRPITKDPELDAKLTWADVRALADDPLFIVGGHTHTHRIMTHLDPDALDEEIETSLGLLRAHTGREVRHYSYPEGQPDCYSADVIARLKARGIVCSPTAIPGRNPRGTDPFELRRIPVV